MGFWSAVIAIAAIIAFAWVRVNQHRTGLPGEPATREPELEREIERLRQRIAVLERITIEERGSGDRLAREIEALRD